MSLKIINEYEALSFMMERDIFDEYKHEAENKLHIAFVEGEVTYAILSVKKISDKTGEIFFSIKEKMAETLTKQIKQNLEDLWILAECEKLITFIKSTNRKSLLLSGVFGFKRIGTLENFGTEGDKSYNMIIKQLDRG